MPPCRPSLSAQASIEPEFNPTKRKRTGADDVERKKRMQSGRTGPSSKPSAKPPSRSNTCTSSRQHRALDEVTELEEDEPEKEKSRKSVEDEDDEIVTVELPKPRRGRANKIVQDNSEVQEVKASRRSSARPRTIRLRETAKVEASKMNDQRPLSSSQTTTTRQSQIGSHPRSPALPDLTKPLKWRFQATMNRRDWCASQRTTKNRSKKLISRTALFIRKSRQNHANLPVLHFAGFLQSPLKMTQTISMDSRRSSTRQPDVYHTNPSLKFR